MRRTRRRPGAAAGLLDTAIHDMRTGRFERTLAALTTAGAAVTAGEIHLSHDGASFGNKMMWWPIVVVPTAIPAGIAAVVSPRAAHTVLPLTSAAIVANGLQRHVSALAWHRSTPRRHHPLQPRSRAARDKGPAVADTADGRGAAWAVYGDNAYGTGAFQQFLHEQGIFSGWKTPRPTANNGLFTKDSFGIDLAAGTVTCPNGLTAPIRRRPSGAGTASFGTACARCPLQAQCSTARAGHKIAVGVHEEHLARARNQQKDPAWIAVYQATRPKVERKLGHLMWRRLGGRPRPGPRPSQSRRRLLAARRRRQPRPPGTPRAAQHHHRLDRGHRLRPGPCKGRASGPAGRIVTDWRERAACREEDPAIFFPIGATGPVGPG